MTSKRLSVVIPTRERQHLVRKALGSLGRQTLDRDLYEVIVVDDGSTDETEATCKSAAEELQLDLTYLRIPPSGSAAAKNEGIAAARGDLLFFFDDDDEASAGLLEAHVSVHRRRPELEVAVLGRTEWHPSLTVTPVMEYATEIGMDLFSYPLLRDRQELGFAHFWTGRLSCKRALLVEQGVFDPALDSRLEDIELGYRLSRRRLKVIFERRLLSHMNRPVDFDDMCRRCEAIGAALVALVRLHPESEMRRYCRLPDPSDGGFAPVEDARRLWGEVGRDLEARVARVRELEGRIGQRPLVDSLRRLNGLALRASWHLGPVRRELAGLYGSIFAAFRISGAAHALARENPVAAD